MNTPFEVGPLAVLLLAIASSVQVLWYSVTQINSMTRSTCLPMRLAHILMATSAASVLFCPLFNEALPKHAEVALMAAIAIMTLYDRRHPASNEKGAH